LAGGPGLAERADRTKPVTIEANSMIADEGKRLATFEGKVVLTQGSLVIRAERIVIRQDSEGFRQGVATGSPATFLHKREGLDEYICGEALRVEYDNKLDRVEFFDKARLRRDSGDDIRGDYISYDAANESFAVKSGTGATGASREGRVSATIMPKKPPAAEAPVSASAGPRCVPR
jgi:lipopolysaccharide export system protein LptA